MVATLPRAHRWGPRNILAIIAGLLFLSEPMLSGLVLRGTAATAIAGQALAVEPTPKPNPPKSHNTKPHNILQKSKRSTMWQERAELRPFENVEGILLIDASITQAGRDTSGVFALDTGAGFVALDAQLARTLGLTATEDAAASIGTAEKPIGRLQIGRIQFDQVQPVLTINAEIVRQVTERPVLGLIGSHLLTHHMVVIDYRASQLGLIAPTKVDSEADQRRPASDPARARSKREPGSKLPDMFRASRELAGDALGPKAVPIAFKLAGDDKVLVSARVSNRASAMSDTLTLVVDTGATKTALFTHALNSKAAAHDTWPSLRGLTAPTLVGSEEARLARVRNFVVGQGALAARATDVDVAVLDSPLERALSAEVGEPVDGLLGYSFLRRYRVVIDFPSRVLWLDPVPHTYDERPFEYSHVGLQIERRNGALRAVGIAMGSPADRAGIERDDEILAIDGQSASDLDVISASKLLEGRPGSPVQITLRRGSNERTYRLVRRRLL